MTRHWQDRLNRIAADNEHGADMLTRQSIALLRQVADEYRDSEHDPFRATFQHIAAHILQGQPSMAPLLNLFNQAAAAVYEAPSAGQAAHRLTTCCDDLEVRLDTAQAAIDRWLMQQIEADAVILTISYSGTVASAIRHLHRAGRDHLRVICLESRPHQEGRQLARHLAGEGIPVTLCVDAALMNVLPAATIWLAGADALTGQGVVNKIGTTMLARLAADFNLTGCILSNLTKCWPPSLPTPPIAQQPAADIWPGDLPAAVTVDNRYFELVPWHDVPGLICEKGCLTPDQLRPSLQALTVHPAIRAVLADGR